MKYSKNIVGDISRYFDIQDHCNNPKFEQLSLFSIVGTFIYGINDKKDFIYKCGDIVKSVFEDNSLKNMYTLYLLAIKDIKDPNSKIEKYKKIWKAIELREELKNFNLGPEIEIDAFGNSYFVSVGETNIKNFISALTIMVSNPQRYVLFAASKMDISDNNKINELFKIAFNKKEEKIEFLNIALDICSNDGVFFRWGDSSEEAELDIIFNKMIFSRLNF